MPGQAARERCTACPVAGLRAVPRVGLRRPPQQSAASSPPGSGSSLEAVLLAPAHNLHVVVHVGGVGHVPRHAAVVACGRRAAGSNVVGGGLAPTHDCRSKRRGYAGCSSGCCRGWAALEQHCLPCEECSFKRVPGHSWGFAPTSLPHAPPTSRPTAQTPHTTPPHTAINQPPTVVEDLHGGHGAGDGAAVEDPGGGRGRQEHAGTACYCNDAPSRAHGASACQRPNQDQSTASGSCGYCGCRPPGAPEGLPPSQPRPFPTHHHHHHTHTHH